MGNCCSPSCEIIKEYTQAVENDQVVKNEKIILAKFKFLLNINYILSNQLIY